MSDLIPNPTEQLGEKLQEYLNGTVKEELTKQIGAVIPGGIEKIVTTVSAIQTMPDILTASKSSLTAAVRDQVNTQLQAVQSGGFRNQVPQAVQSGGSRKIRRKRRKTRARKL